MAKKKAAPKRQRKARGGAEVPGSGELGATLFFDPNGNLLAVELPTGVIIEIPQ